VKRTKVGVELGELAPRACVCVSGFGEGGGDASGSGGGRWAASRVRSTIAEMRKALFAFDEDQVGRGGRRLRRESMTAGTVGNDFVPGGEGERDRRAGGGHQNGRCGPASFGCEMKEGARRRDRPNCRDDDRRSIRDRHAVRGISAKGSGGAVGRRGDSGLHWWCDLLATRKM